MNLRIGLGFDRHRLVAGRPMILGGVPLPCDRGLLGHSDADALLHAACDAVLGAAGLDDIGSLFPDSDSTFAGADSSALAREVMRRVHERGGVVQSMDAVIVADEPKIGPHRLAIRRSLAQLFGCPLDAVNVKGKTTEGGDNDRVDCTVVALLSCASSG